MARNYKADTIRDEVSKAQKAIGAEDARHDKELSNIARNYAGDLHRDKQYEEANRHRDAVEGIKADARARIRGYADTLRAQVSKGVTDPMSDEAFRTLTAARTRRVERSEFDMLSQRYGDNYQAVKLLEAIAEENGYGGTDMLSALRGDGTARRLVGYASSDIDEIERVAISALGKDPDTIAGGVAFLAVSQAADALAQSAPDA